MRHDNQRGYTLVELMIVVVIIGIIAAIAIPRFINSKVKAYTAAMKSDLRNLVPAEAAYFVDSARYTNVVGDMSYRTSTGVSTPQIVAGVGYWAATVTHAMIANPPITCGISVSTTNTVVASAGDGEPACR